MIDNITTFTYTHAWASDELEITWSESYEDFFGLALIFWLEGMSDN